MSTKCHIATFGCRVNQADSEGIVDLLAQEGMERTSTHLDADVVVINSCTVTHRSDADIRKLVNRVRRENDGAKVVVTGCYAQRDPEALVQLGRAHAIVGNSDSGALVPVVRQLMSTQVDNGSHTPIVVRRAFDAMDPEDLPPVKPVAVVHDRTRPFIKIQDGCDAHCTYCVIPDVRGAARSASDDEVIDAVRGLIDRGYFEVVLTGIHLGTYGGAEDGEPLLTLVERILEEVDGLGRLRMSCIEPMAFPVQLASVAANDRRLAPHFHLPLQAGDDAVLKRMARPYRSADFARQIAEIRDRLPEACIGTDIIVGFPGESEEAFERTCLVSEEIGFDYIHVFSYSDRPGVPSTRLGGKVDPRFVKQRSTTLNAIGKAQWRRFLDRQIGQTLDVLTLQPKKTAPELTEALADNYAPVHIEQVIAPNVPLRVTVTGRDDSVLVGRPA